MFLFATRENLFVRQETEFQEQRNYWL